MHTPDRTHTPTQNININNNNINLHKEYGDELTTICTQCRRILLPFSKGSSGISIRVSNDDVIEWTNSDSLPVSQSTPSLSHGLCRSCFNNINTDLLSTLSQDNPRRTILSKSLSSPQLSRHLPSRPKRVLIVDDNRLQRQIHKRMVEHAGFECDVAISGNQALELVQKHSYSYILMDLMMSPMDGWTTSKKIKQSLLQSLGFSSSSPKIIAITGLDVDEKLTKKCKDSGMDDVLHKPISTEMLNKVLHKNSNSNIKLDR